MVDLFDCINKRRDVRHFLKDDIPDNILSEALLAAHHAPSVGLSTPWRFVVTRNPQIKSDLHDLYQKTRRQVTQSVSLPANRKNIHRQLKLAAILDSPVGVGIFCEEPAEEEYTIGVIGSRETLQWSCACAVQNFWLALTARGYGAGWVSILDFSQATKLFDVPSQWKFMGYLCVGKPASDYEGQPMLTLSGWRKRPENIPVIYR